MLPGCIALCPLRTRLHACRGQGCEPHDQRSMFALCIFPQALLLPSLLPARFVDDTNVYRVTIHKTFEGNLVGRAGGCKQAQHSGMFLRARSSIPWCSTLLPCCPHHQLLFSPHLVRMPCCSLLPFLPARPPSPSTAPSSSSTPAPASSSSRSSTPGGLRLFCRHAPCRTTQHAARHPSSAQG